MWSPSYAGPTSLHHQCELAWHQKARCVFSRLDAWQPVGRQVHKTNGQYTRARKKMEELEAAAVVEGGSRRRHLLASGSWEPASLRAAEAADGVASPGVARSGTGGRELQAWGKKKAPPPPPPAIGSGTTMYMVVGFEVVACSISRRPGAARLDDIPCPVSPEDPDAPTPMEVKEGAHRLPPPLFAAVLDAGPDRCGPLGKKVSPSCAGASHCASPDVQRLLMWQDALHRSPYDCCQLCIVLTF